MHKGWVQHAAVVAAGAVLLAGCGYVADRPPPPPMPTDGPNQVVFFVPSMT